MRRHTCRLAGLPLARRARASAAASGGPPRGRRRRRGSRGRRRRRGSRGRRPWPLARSGSRSSSSPSPEVTCHTCVALPRLRYRNFLPSVASERSNRRDRIEHTFEHGGCGMGRDGDPVDEPAVDGPAEGREGEGDCRSGTGRCGAGRVSGPGPRWPTWPVRSRSAWRRTWRPVSRPTRPALTPTLTRTARRCIHVSCWGRVDVVVGARRLAGWCEYLQVLAVARLLAAWSGRPPVAGRAGRGGPVRPRRVRRPRPGRPPPRGRRRPARVRAGRGTPRHRELADEFVASEVAAAAGISITAARYGRVAGGGRAVSVRPVAAHPHPAARRPARPDQADHRS